MDYTKVLKQAWKNVINYRALWVFGLILALTTVSSTSTLLSDRARQEEGDWEGFMGTGVTLDIQPGDNCWEAFGEAFEEMGDEFQKGIDEADEDLTKLFKEEWDMDIQSDFLKFLTVMLWIAVVFFVVGRVLRYVSETALIMMVNDREETGEQLRIRDGFRLGWSLTSWRLFLIELIINIPTALVFMILFAAIFTPLLLLALGITEVSVFSGVLTSGLFFIFIFLAIIAAQVIRLVKHFARRECAVKKLSPIDAIRSGFNLVKGNLKDVGIIWLVLIGVNIGWPVLMGIFAILLIAIDIVVSGVLGLLGGLTANLAGAAEPVLVGFLVGIPLFMLLLIIPLLFLNGLKEVFESSTWTLTYRELRALTGLKAEAVPEPDAA
jgi:hypothetical protein